MLRRRSIAGRRDGAGEKHLGGRGKIAEELLTGVCLKEEFGIAPEIESVTAPECRCAAGTGPEGAEKTTGSLLEVS